MLHESASCRWRPKPQQQLHDRFVREAVAALAVARHDEERRGDESLTPRGPRSSRRKVLPKPRRPLAKRRGQLIIFGRQICRTEITDAHPENFPRKNRTPHPLRASRRSGTPFRHFQTFAMRSACACLVSTFGALTEGRNHNGAVPRWHFSEISLEIALKLAETTLTSPPERYPCSGLSGL